MQANFKYLYYLLEGFGITFDILERKFESIREDFPNKPGRVFVFILF